MSSAPRAWVLNLDAEEELAARGAYVPSRRVAAIVARERRRLLGNLVGPDDVVLTGGPQDARARGLDGVAWSPTPRALARLSAAGARVADAPAPEVLRAVNARPFAAVVRAPLAPDGLAKELATTLEDALALLARPAAEGWLVRRAFGAAGRGRRRIAAGAPDEAERAWLAASLRDHPLIVEPWVRVEREYTRSGLVHASGEVVVARPCLQATTASGAWTCTEPAARGEVSRSDDARLEEAARAAGAALARAGYFGPFGIDAFRHRTSTGASVLNPLSEINARFTMDWSTGMGRATRALAAAPGRSSAS